MRYNFKEYAAGKQYAVSLISVAMVSAICFLTVDYIGYQVVAFILLFVVSILAMLLEIVPVLLAAFFSAVVWNFFFIPPIYTFHIGTPEDVLFFLMYFVIASINAVLTFKIRQIEERNRKEIEKAKTVELYNTLLNSLSHELKTPLVTIIGAVDTIKEGGDKLDQNNKVELLSEIEKASLRLNKQVENLLSMSRLEAGFLKPRLDWCDVNELVFNVIANSKDECSKHRISFVANEDLPLFRIDRGLLEQIIRNLIQNAVAHTPENSLIQIIASHKDDSLILEIIDNGMGFSEKDMEKVFSKFYRLNTEHTGGLGLGLSIVKGFTEAMNGKVILKNNDTGGAHFIISIPSDTQDIYQTDEE